MKQPSSQEATPQTRKDTGWRNLAAFAAMGFLNQLYISIGLAAAQDILTASYVPTSVILIVATLPYFATAVLFPSVLPRVGLLSRFVAAVFFGVAGCLLFCLPSSIPWRLVGVGTVTIGVAIGEVTFVTLTALYEDNTVSCYSFGTGIGYTFGPVYYSAMTTVACVRPKITLLSMIFVPFLLLIVYALMEKRSHSTTPSNDTTRPDVPYTPLNQDESANSPEQATLTWREKASVLRANGTLIFSFFVGYVAEFLSLHGVATTLAFPNAPFGPRNHYVYYATAFMLGESVGRCYLLVLGSCRTKTDLAIERTWVFSLVLSCILFFLCFAAWFRFLPSVWFVLVLMLVVGFLAGALYVNTYMVAGRDQDSLRKEFSRAMLPWSPAAGMVAAGFIGLVTEPALRRHCTEIASSVEYCFTRSMHGWNASTSCLITH